MNASYERRARRCGLAFLVLVSAALPAAAETQRSVVRDTASHIWHDQRRIFTAPLRTSRNDLIIWGTAGVSLLVLAPNWGGNSSLDERFEQNIDRDDLSTRPFLRGITHVGDAEVLIGGSLVMYGVGYWAKQPRLATGSLHVFEGLIDTGIVLYLTKMIAGRQRPVEQPVDGSFHGPVGFFGDSNNDSFPSGHAALSFAAATIISHESANKWVGLSAYGVATTISYSRIYVEKHWASDVIAGMALGYSVGVLVEKYRHAREDATSRIIPTIQPESVGLAWEKRF